MSKPCTVCAHPSLDEINRALVRGDSARKIAAVFRDISEDALHRHRQSHLPSDLLRARAAEEAARAQGLFEELEHLVADARVIKDEAQTARDWKVALAAIRELARLLELTARLDGHLSEHRQIDIRVDSAEWENARSAILNSLDKYPEARAAVAEALHV